MSTKHYRNDEAIEASINLIKSTADKLKISRQELASRMDITVPQITNALSGEADIRISTIARYLECMGVKLQLSVKKNGVAPTVAAPAKKPEKVKKAAKKQVSKAQPGTRAKAQPAGSGSGVIAAAARKKAPPTKKVAPKKPKTKMSVKAKESAIEAASNASE